MKYRDWDLVVFFICAAAVIISVVAAITYYNVTETTTMARAGLCSYFDASSHAWQWKKCL